MKPINEHDLAQNRLLESLSKQHSSPLDIQKKSYHTPRFYQPTQTPKSSIEGSPYEVIYNQIVYKYEILSAYIECNCAVLWINKDDIFFILKRLKELGYETLSDMSAVDTLALNGKLEMFYQLHSTLPTFSDKRRLRVRCYVGENEAISSVSSLFALAIWSEREAFDMLGISFIHHPALSRLIMPKDWVGHPLRRSYPLQGDEYASWYEVDKIFGKEYREVIGAEQRDSARIEEKDIDSFSKIYPLNEKGEMLYPKAAKALFVKNVIAKKQKRLKKRK